MLEHTPCPFASPGTAWWDTAVSRDSGTARTRPRNAVNQGDGAALSGFGAEEMISCPSRASSCPGAHESWCKVLKRKRGENKEICYHKMSWSKKIKSGGGLQQAGREPGGGSLPDQPEPGWETSARAAWCWGKTPGAGPRGCRGRGANGCAAAGLRVLETNPARKEHN